MDTLSCSKCHQVKPVSAFTPERTMRGYRLECKPCRAAYEKARRAANPEPHRQSARAYYYKHQEREQAEQRARYSANAEAERRKARERYRNNVEQQAANNKRYRVENRERIRTQRHAKYWGDPEKIRAEQRERNRQLPPEKKAERHAKKREYYRNFTAEEKAAYREKRRAMRAANPEVYRASSARSNARRRKASVNDLTAAQWQAIKEHYGHRCVYCGRKMQRLTRDHIIPLAKGGGNTYTNVVPACQTCNSKKGTRKPLVPVQPLLLL